MEESIFCIAIQTFHTLTELCQGPCPDNQAALVSCNVTSDVNTVLEEEEGVTDRSCVVLRGAFVLRSACVGPAHAPPPFPPPETEGTDTEEGRRPPPCGPDTGQCNRNSSGAPLVRRTKGREGGVWGGEDRPRREREGTRG